MIEILACVLGMVSWTGNGDVAGEVVVPDRVVAEVREWRSEGCPTVDDPAIDPDMYFLPRPSLELSTFYQPRPRSLTPTTEAITEPATRTTTTQPPTPTTQPPSTEPPTTEPTTEPPSDTGMGSGVEQWRELVELHFGPNTDAALRVMKCESGGNPNARNPSSGSSGLFQFMPFWWEGNWDPFDAERNIREAAKLSKGGNDWSHWVCKP